MNITNKQIEQLKEALGAKKLGEIIPDLKPLFDPRKIYIYKGYGSDGYKLNCIDHSDNIYAFVDLSETRGFVYGEGSAEELIEKAGTRLRVFDNYSDFIKWAYSNLK